MAMKDVRMYESDPMAIVEYDISSGGKATISQKNAHAYLAVGGYWIDVHLSQISFNPKAEDPFAPVLEQIRVNESYVHTAQEHLGYASYYYLKEDYAKSAKHYEEVLNRQASERTLDHDSWRMVIDQLGMSYGLSGQPGKTRDLLQWAIPVDPEYPMFYYSLACAYAEMGDPDQALSNLRLAYQYKLNMLPNETFPDPKKDPSFKKLLKDKKFRAELDKLK
jgi:tetratricopeptide (TPR) repeat protein